MLVQRLIEQVKVGCGTEYAELIRSLPDYGPAPPHGWRVYRAAHFAPWDVVVTEFEFESIAEREAWWEGWSGSTPSQREWYDKRKEFVDCGGRSELWRVDQSG